MKGIAVVADREWESSLVCLNLQGGPQPLSGCLRVPPRSPRGGCDKQTRAARLAALAETAGFAWRAFSLATSKGAIKS